MPVGLEILDPGGMLDTTDNNDTYQGEDLTIPPKRFEKLEVNGEIYDLRDPDNVQEAKETTHEYREQMQDNNLPEYEGRSTEIWGGGRSKLLYDELRAKLAEDFHKGKHSMTWDQQDIEAKRIIKIRAAQLKAQGV
jgi:hypothetical protein